MKCVSPINIEVDGHKQLVPCGRCPACKANKSMDWIIRLSQEQKHVLNTYFVTLTYRDSDLPVSSAFKWDGHILHEFKFFSLSKVDLQKFLKRLRKNTNLKMRYFFCGEYGPQTLRPHYHGLIFVNGSLSFDDIKNAWQHQDIDYKCFYLASSGAAQAYCTKYLTKTVFLPDYIKLFGRPFNLMSKKLGVSYLENPEVYFYHKDNSIATIHYDGKKLRLPRYYRDKIFTNEIQKDLISLNNNEFQEHKQKQLENKVSKNGLSMSEYSRQCYSEAYRKAWKRIKTRLEI